MAYYLGVDLGTSYTAAAVWRKGLVEAVPLGDRAPTVPSVVMLRETGEVLTGEPAERAGASEPLRVAREFRRRLGDQTPVSLDAEAHTAEELTGLLLRWVVDTVAERHGGRPAGIAVSHPLAWGDGQVARLREVFGLAGLDGVGVVTDPRAAAVHHATQDQLAPGSVVAVYDLGGGTFDAAVLCGTETGWWEILGRPEGIERLGGVDVDEAVFNHVADSLGGALDVLDPDDPTALAAVARLRLACVEAKEALSARSDVSIPVTLPTLRTTVGLSRAELEQMVGPPLDRTVSALDRSLRSAGVETSDLTAMLLMGGASRMPLVARRVGELLERPVRVADDPKAGVALGAAIVAAGRDVSHAAATTRVRAALTDPAASLVGVGAAGVAGAAGQAPTEPLAPVAAGVTGLADPAPGLASTRTLEPTAWSGAASPSGAGTVDRTDRLEPTRPFTPTPDRPFAPIGPLVGRPGQPRRGAGAREGERRGVWVVTGGIVAAVVVVIAVAALGGGGGKDGDDDREVRSDAPTSTVVPGDQDGTSVPGSTVSPAPADGTPGIIGLSPDATPATTIPPTSAPPATAPTTTGPPATFPTAPPTTTPTTTPPPTPGGQVFPPPGL
jgi:molecular chaperone DnaK